MSVSAVTPLGDRALLVSCTDLETVHRLHRAILRRRPAGVVDVVPGWDSVLVVAEPGAAGALDALADELPRWPAEPLPEPGGCTVDVPVVYDGPDLHAVAELTGLTVDEVVERHAAPTYTVAFLGFTPGFPYLTGLDAALHVPRLSTPRTSVPEGSVGIGGEHTGVYPQATPGGWRLIGRTDLRLFDPDRDPPALLGPGDRLRFVPA